MKEFILGMIVAYVVLNIIVWIVDSFDLEYYTRRIFPLGYVFTYLIEVIIGFKRVLPFLPLCVKYKINPFWTSLLTIKNKLDTQEKKEEWLSILKETFNKIKNS